MNTLIINAILEASEAELREVWGDEEFERLAEEASAVIEQALRDQGFPRYAPTLVIS